MNAMKRRREESWECSYCRDDGCGKSESESGTGMVFLHNVEHKGMLRLLCTNCVLMTHPDLFCSICLQPFQTSTSSGLPLPLPRPLPVSKRLMCLKCPSIAHLSCSSSSSFLCPPCTSRSSTSSSNSHAPPPPFRWFFSNNSYIEEANANGVLFDRDRDRNNAKALLAAATIAAFSMNKAAIAARAHAESLVKDALSAKKRATQALDILAHLLAIDHFKNQPSTT